MDSYSSLAIHRPEELVFGTAPRPLTTRRGLVLGGGRVYPEINFTLPTMTIDESSWSRVLGHYREIVTGVLARASRLAAPGVVIECETLPDMTDRPDWAVEICKVLLGGMEDAYAKMGVKSALRMTPNDNREMIHPPRLRSGRHHDAMFEVFERCAEAGAELLSIESTGGKEIHDEALTFADIRQVLFALCILGERDMRYLWTRIAKISDAHGVHAAGDTACGFGNTAMVLAEQGLIPRVFAAVVRPITAVRSLAAYACGAVGPGKDCGYENPILKAITGFPMSMEGKTAACAHLSPVGNVAAAACDLWSNESVQNVKLLGGMAPVCYMEQLEYDCRLMNRAIADGSEAARTLRKWLVDSDARLDPQAFVLTPENTIRFARCIVDAPTPYAAGVAVARSAVDAIREAHAADRLALAARETPYLDLIECALDGLPDEEEAFIAQMMDEVDTEKFVPRDYGIDAAGGTTATVPTSRPSCGCAH